ncbi:MAG: hypothetical protein ACYDGR_06745 [Candidatus Dormibacteria bacterium]
MRVNDVHTVLSWAREIIQCRAEGESNSDGELLEYQRAKVTMLEKIAELPEAADSRTGEVREAARARLAEMEAGATA